MPDKLCLELKSLKMYMLAYRNLGIFYENVVNRVLREVVKAADPVYATVVGEFTPRGGLQSKIVATWSKERGFGLAPVAPPPAEAAAAERSGSARISAASCCTQSSC